MEDTLLGVPVTRDLPCSLDEGALKKAAAEKEEIEKIGLTVTGVHISAPDRPLHFFVKFAPGKGSWEARGKLEAAGYAVRQKMTPTDLCFYVTKAVTEAKSWAAD